VIGRALVLLALLSLSAACLAADSRVRPDLCPGHSDSLFARHHVKSVDFSFFFRSLDTAIDAAAMVDERRFEVKVWRAAVGDLWRVFIEYRELPTAAQFAQDKAALRRISNSLSGEFWDASCTSFPFKASNPLR
jgi:hypothetical protein